MKKNPQNALKIDAGVRDAWSRLTDDTNTISWIACKYNPESPNNLEFKGEGTGGMPEFIAYLSSDEIVWGSFKVVGVDDRGNLVSRRPKFIFVKYLPASVPTMKRARAGRHAGEIKAIINAHIDVEVSSPQELTEDYVIQKLRAAGGAHQPTSYEFSNYSS
eukprot:gene33062-42773_t